MKKVALTAAALVFGMSVVSTSFAADPPKARDVKDRAAFSVDAAHMDTKHLVGLKVLTPDGKHVGEIDHLIMHTKDGKVSHAIVGVGGVGGIGERQVVVPWKQVRIGRDKDGRGMAATIDRAALDAAPRYTRVDRDGAPAASPATAPARDRDGDGVRNRSDRAPDNPKKY